MAMPEKQPDMAMRWSIFFLMGLALTALCVAADAQPLKRYAQLGSATAKKDNPQPAAQILVGAGRADGILSMLMAENSAKTPRHIILTRTTTQPSDTAAEIQPEVSLEQAVSRTKERNPDLLAENESYRASWYMAWAGLGQYGPALDVRVGQGTESSHSSLSDQPVLDPRHVRTDMAFVVRQPLFLPGAIVGYLRDDALADAAGAKRDATAEQATYDTVATYLDLVRAQLDVELAREYQAQMDRLASYIKERFDAGAASGADMERVHAVALSAQRMMLDAGSGLDAALVNFSRLTGVTPLALSVPAKLLPETPETVEQALAATLESADLKSARAQIDAAEYDKTATWAKSLPQIDMELGQYSGIDPSGQKGMTRDVRVMFVASWQLNPVSTAATSIAQIAKQREAEQRYRSARMQAEQMVRANYLALDGLGKQLSVADQEYKTNKSVATAFDAQLSSNSRSLLDVLDTYQKLYTAKRTLGALLISNIEVRYQVLKNISRINHAILEEARDGEQ